MKVTSKLVYLIKKAFFSQDNGTLWATLRAIMSRWQVMAKSQMNCTAKISGGTAQGLGFSFFLESMGDWKQTPQDGCRVYWPRWITSADTSIHKWIWGQNSLKIFQKQKVQQNCLEQSSRMYEKNHLNYLDLYSLSVNRDYAYCLSLCRGSLEYC